MSRGDDGQQAAGTLRVMERVGLPPGKVWMCYISLGGGADEFEVNAYLHGLHSLPALDRDMITHAVNELYDDICHSARAPYSSDLPRTERRHP